MDTQIMFLVGMPRSGTKLLRDLLNNHADVAIFPHESRFFPTLNRELHSYGDITSWAVFSKLFADYQDATFFRRMRQRGTPIDAETWFHELQGSDIRDLLQALFKAYGKQTGCAIVGDKTPGYINQLPLLGTCFPSAKFVHIYRDPRDYGVSIRKAWGKHLLRAVQRWKQGIRRFRADTGQFGLNYCEIRYEDLVTNPQETLRNVCRFLDISFNDAMMNLTRPTENIGAARGAMTIVSTNFGKWRKQLSDREVNEIESIAGSLMGELGYSVDYQAGDRDLSSLAMAIGSLHDAIQIFRHAIREENGILKGLRQTLRFARFR